jgi:ribosome-associated heat shock protein Hsp15
MKVRGESTPASSIRIDRLLVYLRFARTRSAAAALIAAQGLRHNRAHVRRGSQKVRVGDVLTIATGGGVRVIELLALPKRRGSPAEALLHYRELDANEVDPRWQKCPAGPPPLAEAKPDIFEDFA